MEYTIRITLINPAKPEVSKERKLTATFSYDPTQYGNGYHLYITDKADFEVYLDIRYDSSFNPEDKPAYLFNWANGYWNGNNGAFAVKSLLVTEIQ